MLWFLIRTASTRPLSWGIIIIIIIIRSSSSSKSSGSIWDIQKRKKKHQRTFLKTFAYLKGI